MSREFGAYDVFLLFGQVQRIHPVANPLDNFGLLFCGQFKNGFDNLLYG